ncbi:FBP domain-containing protein [Paenibacillus sp. 2RAB27]|uniref:FBP domain-containing protein n=1 Tax=Paenibacillus sp. 2RAB27 TaxID=3232991 RepID=UPI003F94BDDB
MPDLKGITYRFATYLGWTDIATNKLFIVYDLNGKLIGIEGKYTPTNKKGVCFVCNRHTEVALFTAVTKWKPEGASPDYYRAIGNYLCVNSEVCNKNITDVEVLEKFIHGVLVGP